MDFKEQSAGPKVMAIHGYGAGAFRISGKRYIGPAIVMADAVHAAGVATLAEFSEDHLAPIFSAEPAIELLLIGCGPTITPLAPELEQGLSARDLAFDLMDTGAAARTYNVLLMEGRRVAAVLFPVE